MIKSLPPGVFYVACALSGASLMMAACSTGNSGGTAGTPFGGVGGATDGGAGTSGAGGGAGTAGTTGVGGGINLDGAASDGPVTDATACANESAEATLVKKPVDILFVIDNSCSMRNEIGQVEANISTNFANIIEASGVDYRVIMLSRHRTGSGIDICVEAPLSGIPAGGCASPPGAPVNGPRYFHYDQFINSHDTLCVTLDTFSSPDPHGFAPTGWQGWLREEAFKVIVPITDDGVRCDSFDDGDNVGGGTTVAGQFDTALLGLSPAQFGTAAERNYQWYSIVALQDFNPTGNGGQPTTDAWPPTDPVTSDRCTPGSAGPGTGYQGLSVLTGGLRYPTCWADRPGGTFDVIFQKIAEGVIAGAQVACEFDVPEPPMGEEIDFETVKVEYTPSDGSPAQTFDPVPDVTQCAPGKFYIENEQKIFLCPDTCTTVQADDAAKIGILFGCKTGPAQ